MPNMDVIRRLEMRADVPGASEAAAQLRNLQGGFEAMQRAAEAATKSVEKNGQTVISTDRQYQNFLRRTVPGFREFEQFTRDVNMLDAALSQGRGIQEFGRNFDLARQRLPEVRAEMARMREESAAIDRALEQTRQRVAASAASWQEYQERIAAARHAQNSAEFGRNLNERLIAPMASGSARASASVFEEQFRQDEAEQDAINRAMERRRRQIEAQEAEHAAYQERIETLRYQQGRADFGRAYNDRMGIGGPAATSQGASYSSLAEREAAIVAAHKAAEDEITKAVRDQRVEYERLSRVRSDMLQRADPLGFAQERHNQMLVEANTLRQKGLLTEEQRAKVIASETLTMRKVQRDFGEGTSGFRSFQRQNLGYQGYDIITGLASGQPLGLIAGQQLPQIMQILGDHEGGIRGGVKALGQDLLGLLSPARLAFGGMVTLAGAAVYSTHRLDESMKELRLSTFGRGLGTGLTPQDLNALAMRNAATAGVSEATARQTIGIYAGTGRIDPSLLGRLGDVSRDYALTTGQDLPAATKEFASALADPTRGLELLEDRLGRVDAGAAEFIRRQAAIGNRAAASTALFEAFNGRLARHREHVTGLSAAWEALAKAVSDGLDWYARGAQMAARFGSGPGITDYLDPSRRPAIDAAQRAAGERTAMQTTIAAMTARQDGERDRISNEADFLKKMAEGIDPDIAKVRELTDAHTRLSKTMMAEVTCPPPVPRSL